MSARLIHLSVWQGRRQCAAGRVSRWAVSWGRGPRDAFTALCRQGHKHPWVFFFLLAVLDSSLLVVVNCVYKLKQHMEAWVECVCVSANAFFLKKAAYLKRDWVHAGWCQRASAKSFGVMEGCESLGSSGSSQPWKQPRIWPMVQSRKIHF